MPTIKSLFRTGPGTLTLTLTLTLVCLAAGGAHAAVTINIINANAPGVGFNDNTAAIPVGGNRGTTLGQQRLIAFTYAANIWGSKLTSTVPIRIQASFVALTCTASSAVLGSAGAYNIESDFPGAPLARTWYPSALASKLSGRDVAAPDTPHIVARFNSRLGLAANCLPGSPFYLGLDNNPGSAIDFVTVLLHEMGHGLGFQTFTNDETGEFDYDGLPSVWDHYLLDNRLNRTWVQLTAAQRAASAISGDGLAWNGPLVTGAAPGVLAPVSRLVVAGPAAAGAAGAYPVGDASFGPPLGTPAVSGQLMPVIDQANGAGLACTPLNALNALAVRNNIALVDRGTCAFVIKAAVVQAAGARGMIVVDNVDAPLSGMSGADPAVTIPSVRVTLADGTALRATLARRSRTASGVVAALGVDATQLAGTDAAGHVLMYTPSPLQPGSSVSHYDVSAKPNLLMERAINSDLSHQVEPPRDLTLPLLHDIGW
jgi:hypothetical protein